MNTYRNSFQWHDQPGRRTQLCVELDVYYARLYCLTRDELRYTPFGVDPKEVYREDFPGKNLKRRKDVGRKNSL